MLTNQNAIFEVFSSKQHQTTLFASALKDLKAELQEAKKLADMVKGLVKPKDASAKRKANRK